MLADIVHVSISAAQQNRLAEACGVEYKAVKHHIRVLEKNYILTKTGEKYGVLYFISRYLEP
jgi:hypothetical protein